jgi:hypothetical protein
LVIALCFLPACGTTASQSSPSDIGSESILQAGNLEEIYLTIDKESFDEWSKVAAAKDHIGMLELLSAGKMFIVPAGTKVLVIDSSWAIREVRILEGDAFGRTGWLPYEWLK